MGAHLCVPLIGPTVPTEYTQPGSLYQRNERVDLKKLKNLVLAGKLCPLFPGAEEATPPPQHHEYAAILTRVLLRRKDKEDVATIKEHLALLGQTYEACPICFLHYPALNTSKCCYKRICTECYLQVQTSRAAVPACPFCKVPGYAAKFLGLKTVQEHEQERVEEQKVIEARIREREEEMRRDQEREEQRCKEQRNRPESSPAATPTASPQVGAAHASSAAAGSRSADREAGRVSQGGTPARTARAAGRSHTDYAGTVVSPRTSERGRSPIGTPTRPHAGTDLTGLAILQATQQHARRPRRSPTPPTPPQRWAVSSASGFQLTDFVPMGVVSDMELDMEELNSIMLEQAMFESITAGTAASARRSPGPLQSSGSNTRTRASPNARSHSRASTNTSGRLSTEPVAVVADTPTAGTPMSHRSGPTAAAGARTRVQVAGSSRGVSRSSSSRAHSDDEGARQQQQLLRNRGPTTDAALSPSRLRAVTASAAGSHSGTPRSRTPTGTQAGSTRAHVHIGAHTRGAGGRAPRSTVEHLSEEQQLELAIRLSLAAMARDGAIPELPTGGAERDGRAQGPAATPAGAGPPTEQPTASVQAAVDLQDAHAPQQQQQQQHVRPLDSDADELSSRRTRDATTASGLLAGHAEQVLMAGQQPLGVASGLALQVPARSASLTAGDVLSTGSSLASPTLPLLPANTSFTLGPSRLRVSSTDGRPAPSLSCTSEKQAPSMVASTPAGVAEGGGGEQLEKLSVPLIPALHACTGSSSSQVCAGADVLGQEGLQEPGTAKAGHTLAPAESVSQPCKGVQPLCNSNIAEVAPAAASPQPKAASVPKDIPVLAAKPGLQAVLFGQGGGAADHGAPPTAASVAAAMGTTVHLGMMFVKWDMPSMVQHACGPTTPGQGVAGQGHTRSSLSASWVDAQCHAAAAGSEEHVEVSIESIVAQRDHNAVQQSRLVVVENPDGSICSVVEPGAAQGEGAAQQQGMPGSSQMVLGGEAAGVDEGLSPHDGSGAPQDLSALEQQMGAYGDYDVEQLPSADAALVQSIAARDALLRAAYTQHVSE